MTLNLVGLALSLHIGSLPITSYAFIPIPTSCVKYMCIKYARDLYIQLYNCLVSHVIGFCRGQLGVPTGAGAIGPTLAAQERAALLMH